MSDTPNGALSDEERAELEQLRKEKATREAAEAEARERAELERLRKEKQEMDAEAEAERRIEEARQRMEPGDDLRMPIAQRIIVIICCVLLAVFVTWMIMR